MHVVGVVAPVRQFRLDEDSPRVFLHYPFGAAPAARFYVVARAVGAPGTLAVDIRTVVRALAPTAVIGEAEAMTDLMARSLATRRAGAGLMAGFALVAVFLALMGAYGLVSFRVARERREIGLRLALGADASEVRRLAWRFGFFLGGVGLAFGVPAALFAGRLLRSQLFGVTGNDSISLVLGGAAILVVTVGAAGLLT